MRLVFYSLALPGDGSRADIVRQLDISVSTLRRYNDAIPVVLFVYGPVTPELARIALTHRVRIQEQGSYERRLAELCPVGWRALSRYPLLHKFLNFTQVGATPASQVLFCDCDTVFLGDVDALFDGYASQDVVAREEVQTRRSPYGYDPTFINEELLHSLAHYEGASFVAPFNLGVVLLNHRIWNDLAKLDWLLIDYAWRFVTWMAMNPLNGRSSGFGEFRGLPEAALSAGPIDYYRSLPFPSVNRWILDEVSLWMTLGRLGAVTTADFRERDVVQNGELFRSDPADSGWIVGHYFSQNLPRVERWLQSARTPAGLDPTEHGGSA